MKNYLCKFSSMLLFTATIACNKSLDTVGNPTNNNTGGSTPGTYSGLKLAVSQGQNLVNPLIEISPDTVYSSVSSSSTLFRSLPAGFDDKISSFYLPKGYMVVFASSADGTGETLSIAANNNPIKANLPARLLNTVSYIRYIAINNPEKKGTASTSETTVQSFSAQWYYGWSLNKASFIGQQFVPMTWGKGSCTEDNVKYLVERKDIDHLLSFNEPDNSSQSNIPVIDTAIQRYKVMQKTGLRLGSPVVTQDQAFGSGKWLTNFMAAAQSQKLRIDFVVVHWYDWGNQSNNGTTDSITAVNIFNRFVTFIDKVKLAYPDYPIWVTEYNANINRTSEVVHKYFMKLSSEWMNTNNVIERYSYFFPNSIPALNPDNSFTTAGVYWKNLVSAKSFTGNIIGDAVLIP